MLKLWEEATKEGDMKAQILGVESEMDILFGFLYGISLGSMNHSDNLSRHYCTNRKLQDNAYLSLLWMFQSV